MSEMFRGPLTKIKRANSQIDELNTRITTYFDTHPYELGSEVNANNTEETWRYRLTSPIPDELPVIVGEILFNLRSSLDQMACELAIARTGSSKDVYFPFGKTRDTFEIELLKKTKKLPSDARDLIKAAKPYKGGNHLLWALHDFNRRDKHIELVPVAVSARLHMRELRVYGGALIAVGPRNGTHMIPGPNGLVQPDPSKQPFDSIFNGKPSIEFRPLAGTTAQDSLELITCVPGTKFEAEVDPSLSIALGDSETLEHEPIVAVLHQMRDLAERLILTFQRRFS